ncbi:hypothetical protein G6130_000550 [Salmonella enterica]|nr:hypothetical protein [Salmonella enterica]
MPEKIIALVDYENIGTLEDISLARYERLILFTGPKQDFIRFPAVTNVGNISVSVFQAPCISKNNVDFHLVFELGRLSATVSSDITFHIISNDKGYDSVIAMLCRTGRQCRRITSLSLTEKTKAPPDVISNDEVQRLADKIQASGKKAKAKMPSTLKAFSHYLKPLTGNYWSEQTVNRIKNELVKRKVISVYEKSLVWR